MGQGRRQDLRQLLGHPDRHAVLPHCWSVPKARDSLEHLGHRQWTERKGGRGGGGGRGRGVGGGPVLPQVLLLLLPLLLLLLLLVLEALLPLCFAQLDPLTDSSNLGDLVLIHDVRQVGMVTSFSST